MALHINIEDLLSSRTVESDRIEFKEGWNPDAIFRSICAFANDFDNIGGGYIIIGVAENPLTHTAARPVKGLTTAEIGKIQKEMIGFTNLMRPYYSPKLSIEEVDGQQILVLWVLAGNERPYEVPDSITAKHKNWKYFIRLYANSIEAKGTDKVDLLALTNNIPFDDRANSAGTVNDISMLRLKDFLIKVNSRLADEVGKRTDIEILSQMELISGPKENILPRNVALMLFNDNPHSFFPYTRVEIVHFPKGTGDKEFIEKRIEGPVHQQIIDTLTWIKTNILQEKVTKIAGQAEAMRVWNYPYVALEEIVANCLFHRNYEIREPIKIRIEPHAMLLYNSGGPDRSIKREDFISGDVIPKRYRNRRLGDFLKELKLTEGHATGLPALKRAMQQNGSPEPQFDFDEERTWFQVLLPIHPNFEQNIPITIALNEVIWDINGIDKLLNEVLEKVEFKQNGGIAGGIASGIVRDIAIAIEYPDNHAIAVVDAIDRDIAGGIASGIAGGIDNKLQVVLKINKEPISRAAILTDLHLSNRAKNFETYIQPLVAVNWLTMTIPEKPTSPNQKYLTTLKGRLILEFLKLIGK